ncbi:hypothetical protein NSE_0188 [Neorickettsia sennetsu str. Miyayama]|uniref:Uncharacterized protein n=1 Tax=Ehrlichia sennetsu (strain ATCC VR-367 / Miyayama) TaxID=222891 RepID=Q2GEL3_EHRS3|nr:hypothetical protein NSE_0188 [Neorickettsia sennetsu str. Miyayama]
MIIGVSKGLDLMLKYLNLLAIVFVVRFMMKCVLESVPNVSLHGWTICYTLGMRVLVDPS